MKMKFTLSIIALVLVASVGKSEIPSGYYSSCEGLSKSALKSALYDKIKNHTRISYGSGTSKTWGAFWYTDLRSDGTWWDIYTDDKVSASEGSAGSGMNIEHTMPKSWWGGTKNDAYCDIVHLMPVNGTVNSRRSNYPYAEVASESWSNERSKLGSPKSGQGGGSSTVFEPDDEYKGDLARTYFYMATCYQNLTWVKNGEYTLETGTYPTLKDWAIEMFLEWHRNDPVSQKELDRNEGVYLKQGNRNPFIDHPDMVEHIWGNLQSIGWQEGETPEPPSEDPELISPTPQNTYAVGNVAYGESATIEIPIIGRNFSHTALAEISGQDAKLFKLVFAGMELDALTLTAVQINSEAGHSLKVKYTPTSTTYENAYHSATITLTSSDLQEPVEVYLQGTCYEQVEVMPVVALAATEVTEDSYVANWMASTQNVDYYTVYRNVYDEDGAEIVITEEYEADSSETSMLMNARMNDCKETYTVTATLNGVESEHSNMIIVNADTSIDSIEIVNDSSEEYFYPNGIRIEGSPTQKGIYILRQGNKVVKTTIK